MRVHAASRMMARRVPGPRTPERVCDALMEMAQHNPGPRGVANWQDDRTVLAFLFDGQHAPQG
jgi:hypothetical protein